MTNISRDLTIGNPEAVTALEIDRNIFDSGETEVLGTAFQKAWRYLEFDPILEELNLAERQSELARCLMTLIKLSGESDPTVLANVGITLLHKHQKFTSRRGDRMGLTMSTVGG